MFLGESGAAGGPSAQSFLQNPYYFMFASLAKPDDDAELHWLKVWANQLYSSLCSFVVGYNSSYSCLFGFHVTSIAFECIVHRTTGLLYVVRFALMLLVFLHLNSNTYVTNLPQCLTSSSSLIVIFPISLHVTNPSTTGRKDALHDRLCCLLPVSS